MDRVFDPLGMNRRPVQETMPWVEAVRPAFPGPPGWGVDPAVRFSDGVVAHFEAGKLRMTALHVPANPDHVLPEDMYAELGRQALAEAGVKPEIPLRFQFNQALSGLTSQEKTVLLRRFFYLGKTRPSYRAVAAELGIAVDLGMGFDWMNGEAVRVIEQAAVEKLRQALPGFLPELLAQGRVAPTGQETADQGPEPEPEPSP